MRGGKDGLERRARTSTDTAALEDPLSTGTVPLVGAGPEADPEVRPPIRR